MKTIIIISVIGMVISAWSTFNERQKRKEENRRTRRQEIHLKRKINLLMEQINEIKGYRNLSQKRRRQIIQLCKKVKNLKVENKNIKEQIKLLEEQIKNLLN